MASIGGWITESNYIHLISTFLDPLYGLIGGYYKIFKVNIVIEISYLIFDREFLFHFLFLDSCIPNV